jgi:hypothetical protein
VFGASGEEVMRRGVASLVCGAVLLAAPLGVAGAQWAPGSELVGQSVQVETNEIVNTIYFDPNGAARIVSPSGLVVVQAAWTTGNAQLCLQTRTGHECWPYQTAFQPGQTVTLVSNCQVSSRWTALSTNPVQLGGRRG